MFLMLQIVHSALIFSFSVLVAAGNNPKGDSIATCEARGISGSLEVQKHFNGTTVVPIESLTPEVEPRQPWFFFTTFKDTLLKSLSSKVHTLATFVSLPDDYRNNYGNGTLQLCQYHASRLNVSTSMTAGDESSTCDGIISPECRRELQTLLNPRSSSNYCRSLGPAAGTFEKVCGIHLSEPSSINLSPENDCMVNETPDIDIPDGYRAFAVSKVHLNPADTRVERFDHYDLYMKQATPFVIFSRWNQVSPDAYTNDQRVTSVCLAPRNVTRGSRVPVGDAFPAAESVGIALGVPWMGRVAGSVVFISILLLMG